MTHKNSVCAGLQSIIVMKKPLAPIRLRPDGVTQVRSWLALSVVVALVALLVGYQASRVHAIYKAVSADQDEARRIHTDHVPGLQRYRKARPLVDEVQRDLDAGVASRVLQQYVESSLLFKLITFDSWKLQLGVLVVVLFGLLGMLVLAYYHLIAMPRQASAFENAVQKQYVKRSAVAFSERLESVAAAAAQPKLSVA